MRDLVIFGAGGMARETRQLVEEVNQDEPTWNLLGFLDDDARLRGRELDGLPVLGDASWLGRHPSAALAVALGDSPTRSSTVAEAAELGCRRFATLIHPSVRPGRNVSAGEGTLVAAGSLVSTDVHLGSHVIVNFGCTISHDAVVCDFATLAPGARLCGAARVGEGCELGAGSIVIQGVKIGRWSIVGAGAVVIRDLPANVTAVGAPAHPIKARPEGWQLPVKTHA